MQDLVGACLIDKLWQWLTGNDRAIIEITDIRHEVRSLSQVNSICIFESYDESSGCYSNKFFIIITWIQADITDLQ